MPASDLDDLLARIQQRLSLMLNRARLRSVTPETLIRSPGMTYMTAPLDLDAWPHLIEPYRAPLDEPIVEVAGSQTGKSLLMCFRAFARFLRYGPIVSLFAWPTDELPRDFANNRIPGLFRGLPDEYRTPLEPARMTISEAQFAGNYLYYKGMAIGHQHSTKLQSVPASFVTLDEVRQMPVKEIRMAIERMSGSRYQVLDVFSTAGIPGDMLDSFWQETDQRIWYSDCGCKGGVALAHGWPDTVRIAGRGAVKRVEFCCPKCGKAVKNPRDGAWRRTLKRNHKIGYHLPQTLNPTQSPKALLEAWESCIRNPGAGGGVYFFKSDKLGLIESDPETALIDVHTIRQWRAADNPYSWGPPPGEAGVKADFVYHWPVALGFDVMENLVWGVALTVDLNRGIIVPIWIDRYRGEPEEFIRKRIRQYRPQCVVIDAGPDYNLSRKLCREFDGGVWRAYYSLKGSDTIKWGKLDVTKEGAAASGDTGIKVDLNRGLAAKNFVQEPARAGTLFLPPPHKYPVPGVGEDPAVEEFLSMLQSCQVLLEKNPKTGMERYILSESATLDPHGTHALIYAMTALDRIRVMGRPDAGFRFGAPRAVQ